MFSRDDYIIWERISVICGPPAVATDKLSEDLKYRQIWWRSKQHLWGTYSSTAHLSDFKHKLDFVQNSSTGLQEFTGPEFTSKTQVMST